MARHRREKRNKRNIPPKIFVWSHTEKAEIQYFQDFKNSLGSHILVPKKKIFWEPEKLLDYVVKWKDDQKNKRFSEEDGDQVWCIFDVDDFFKNNPNGLISSIENATENNVKIAFVNECFELWILLHFQTPNISIKRGKDVEHRVQKAYKKEKLGKFKKNQKVFETIFSFQQNAINNSKKLLKVKYEEINWSNVLGENGNPSTTIHLLVEEINRLHNVD